MKHELNFTTSEMMLIILTLQHSNYQNQTNQLLRDSIIRKIETAIKTDLKAGDFK